MGGNRHPDGVRADPATATQLAGFEQAEQSLGMFTAPVLLDESRAEQRLFIASFDGTRNSKRDPAKFTNVALVDEQFRDYAQNAEDRLGYAPIHAGYVEGPGTQGGVSGLIDAVRGSSYEARLEEMYLKFVVQAHKWIVENPDADIRIMATGFSRGAEQVAGFTRMVEERGIQNPLDARYNRDADGLIIGRVVYPNPPLREPGTVIQAATLFDPVGTGVPRLHDRRLAGSVVSAFQITAGLEPRDLFQGTWITDPGITTDGRFLNVTVAGAHSDIGGGYRRDGLGILAGNLGIDYLNATIRPPPLEKRALPEDPDRYVIHRSNEHAFFHRTSIFDRSGTRGMQDLLAPPALCRLDCRDAMPRNEAMAAALEWQRVGIGPVQGSVPIRDAGLENAAFASDLLASAAREDGHAISERLREQLSSEAGQAWLQQGFDALERQSRESAGRASEQSVSTPAMEGPAL
jgi:Uncharacterized alpha/beta hydrolase domain (DUF2235)